MKQQLKNIFTGVLVILIYLLSNYFLTYIVNIDINNFNNNQKIIYNISYELIILSIIIFIYRNQLINDLKKFKYINFIEYIIYWFITILLMSITSIIINILTNINTSNKQKIIVKTFTEFPIYIIILASIIAPILEELVFRLSLRKIFKNEKLFIIISGLFFGFMHIAYSSSILEYLYIIPYSIPGFIFAYTLVKSDNIFVPIGLHFIHNTLMILLQIII